MEGGCLNGLMQNGPARAGAIGVNRLFNGFRYLFTGSTSIIVL